MTNDAKLGLVVGVGLVIVLAVVFFRKDLVPAEPGIGDPNTAARATIAPGRRPVPARPARHTRNSDNTAASPSRAEADNHPERQ